MDIFWCDIPTWIHHPASPCDFFPPRWYARPCKRKLTASTLCLPVRKGLASPRLPCHPPAIPRAPPLQTMRTLSAPSTQRKSKPARSRPLQTLRNLRVLGLPKIMLPLPHSLLEPWCVRPPRSSTRPSLHAHAKTRNLGVLGSLWWSRSRLFGCVRRGGRGCDDENGLWLRRADVALMSQRQTFGRRRRLG